MAKNHLQLSNEEFEQQFEAGILDPQLFNHEAHIRLAWVHISKYGVEQAIENISRQLLNYVNTLGAQSKFNKTLTVAAVRAVYHFKQKSRSDFFTDFIHEFPRLKFNFKELIHSHYSHNLIISDQAKRSYVEPDLLPFT